MKEEYFHGIIASFLILLFYVGIVSLVQGFSHAVQQFMELWYLMLPLIIGFGIQVFLFSHIRRKMHEAKAKGNVVASSGISAGSMIVCCIHHVADFLPIIGFSGIALFLSGFQFFFLLLGIMSNFVGILIMLDIIQKHSIYSKRGFLPQIFRLDMEILRNSAITISIFLLLFQLFSVQVAKSEISESANTFFQLNITDFEELTNEQNGISIAVKPIALSSKENSEFSVSIDTHQGSLDFDPVEISALEDDRGKKYLPKIWEGSKKGGHHRKGKLTFPNIKNDVSSIRLSMRLPSEASERSFEWQIK